MYKEFKTLEFGQIFVYSGDVYVKINKTTGIKLHQNKDNVCTINSDEIVEAFNIIV